MSGTGDSQQFTRRIKVLRNLQIETNKIDKQLLLDAFKLEEEYDHKLAPLLERRRQIISGEYEPEEEESDVPLTYVDIPEVAFVDQKNFANFKGIPVFWYVVLNNIPLFWSMIQRQDYGPLKYLTDISCNKITNPEPGFTLKFHFAPNPFFTNEILTKEYKFAFGTERNNPMNVCAQEMTDCIGCNIDWKERDLTVTVKNKKLIKRQSFFNFFDPPEMTDDPELEALVQCYLFTDYISATYLKERIVQRAVLYYLGEAVLRENFGFGKQTDKKGVNLTDHLPKRQNRNPLLNKEYEQDYKEWENVEKLLCDRLKKRKYEKAEDYEERKVKLYNSIIPMRPKLKKKFLDSEMPENEPSANLNSGNYPSLKKKTDRKEQEEKSSPKKTENITDKNKKVTQTKVKLLLNQNSSEGGKDNKPNRNSLPEGTDTVHCTMNASTLNVDLKTLLEKFKNEVAKKNCSGPNNVQT